MQKEQQTAYPQLYSLWGFRYCDLLLTGGEWREVQQRAEYALNIVQNGSKNLLDIALNNLSLGLSSLQQATNLANSQLDNKQQLVGWISASSSTDYPLDTQLLPKLEVSTTADDASLSTLRSAEVWLNQAVEGLRKAGAEHHLPRGLLARASYHRYALSFNCDVAHMELTESEKQHSVNGTSPHSTDLRADYQCALRDLQEVHDIAQRSGMRLYLTDYHLELARLLLTQILIASPLTPTFPRQETALKNEAIEHISKASQLIDKTGYKRRLPEVKYLEEILQNF